MLKPWNYILAGVTFFIFLALLLSFDSECIQQLDNTLAELFGGNVFITAFHYIGDTWFVISIGLLLLIVLWLKERNYHGMIFVLLTIAAGNVLNQLVKKWIERPRPEIVDQLSTFSFPSGHAMLSLLYLFTIAYLVEEWVGNSKKVELFGLLRLFFPSLLVYPASQKVVILALMSLQGGVLDTLGLSFVYFGMNKVKENLIS